MRPATGRPGYPYPDRAAPAKNEKVVEMSQQVGDRRQVERYPVTADTTCPMAAPLAQDFGAARIKDVSQDGIGLLLTRHVEPGTVIVVALKNEVKKFFRFQLVEVIHSTSQLGGGYLIGGVFLTPLTYEELAALLM